MCASFSTVRAYIFIRVAIIDSRRMLLSMPRVAIPKSIQEHCLCVARGLCEGVFLLCVDVVDVFKV